MLFRSALVGEYPNFEINGVYPLGKHQFRLEIVDGCGNSSTENIRFEVIDCYVPDPHCLNGLILDLEQLPQAIDADNDGDLDLFVANNDGQVLMVRQCMHHWLKLFLFPIINCHCKHHFRRPELCQPNKGNN